MTCRRLATHFVCTPQAIDDALPDIIDPSSVDRTTWKWIAIASAIVAGIVFLLTLLSISRVRIAIACIKVASQAVASVPMVLLFPLLPFVFEVRRLPLYIPQLVCDVCGGSGWSNIALAQSSISIDGFTLQAHSALSLHHAAVRWAWWCTGSPSQACCTRRAT